MSDFLTGRKPSKKSLNLLSLLKKSFLLPIFILFVLIGLYAYMSDHSTMLNFTQKKKPISGDGDIPQVGVINIYGEILESDTILAELDELYDNNDLQALLVRIDSPGGAVGASQEVYERLKVIRENIPVYASMQNVAASGGYYIALGADKIYANKGTLTGSIGVIISGYNVSEVMKKIGLERIVYKAGENKDLLSPYRQASEEEKDMVNSMLMDVHQQFKDAVVENRAGITQEMVDVIADGRIYSGSQAYKERLVDATLSFHGVVDLIKEDLGAESVDLVYPPIDEREYLQSLFQGALNAVGFNLPSHATPKFMFMYQ